jgi:hypothetical protein
LHDKDENLRLGVAELVANAATFGSEKFKTYRDEAMEKLGALLLGKKRFMNNRKRKANEVEMFALDQCIVAFFKIVMNCGVDNSDAWDLALTKLQSAKQHFEIIGEAFDLLFTQWQAGEDYHYDTIIGEAFDLLFTQWQAGEDYDTIIGEAFDLLFTQWQAGEDYDIALI